MNTRENPAHNLKITQSPPSDVARRRATVLKAPGRAPPEHRGQRASANGIAPREPPPPGIIIFPENTVSRLEALQDEKLVKMRN
ncbi:hypothetical protein NL676_006414 [Syzygium grande]|nr:hypothetical protein NL676_006414 [Syzygium grande]